MIRDVMWAGPSGIEQAYSPNDPDKPIYYSSQGVIKWPKSGAKALMVAAEAGDRSRGPNSEILLADEAAAFANGKEFFDDLLMGNRIGIAQTLITTTPRTNDLIVDLYKRQDQDVKIRYGSTLENRDNLSESMVRRAETIRNTRRGQQEVEGKILLENSGAAFNNTLIESATVNKSFAPPREWKRCIISLDPAGSNSKRSDKFGISVLVETQDRKIIVLNDHTDRYTPDQWSKLVGQLYTEFEAICPTMVIYESNGVGQFVGEVLRRDHNYMPVDSYASTTKKFARLESASHLFETGVAFFSEEGEFAGLFEELTIWEGTGKKSPDRADAMSGGIHYIADKARSKAISKEFLF